MKTLASLLIILTISILTSMASANETSAPDNLDSECTQFIDSIKDKYNYKWLQVPVRPDSSKTISIFTYYKKTNSFKNPVIFFNGGPGYTSHGTIDYLESAKTKFGGNSELEIDFIYMDQRGTGCSTHFPIGADPQTLKSLSV